MSSWALARPTRTSALQAGLLAVAIAVPVLTLPSLPELAWLPALALGGVSLLVARRAAHAASSPAPAAA